MGKRTHSFRKWGITLDFYKILMHVLPCIVVDDPEYDLRRDKDNQSISKLKKIAFYNGCHDNRSDRYRVYNIVEELRNNNIIVDIYTAESISYLINHPDYDLLIVFREDRLCLFRWYKIKQYLVRNKIPMIYDTDDLTISLGSIKSREKILKIIEYADAVTTSTKSLADKISKKTGKRTYVIKNTINNQQIFISEKLKCNTSYDQKIKIVYQSGTPTHNEDFKIVEKALLKVLKKYPCVELHIFGPLLVSKKFKDYRNRIVFHKYLNYLALQIYISEMQINIAPLVVNEFNNCKSELKIFEAALMRIPTICSAIPSYTSIIQNGVNGYIASTTKEWESALQELIEDSVKRKKIGDQAYKDFVDMFYIANEIGRIIPIYEEIVYKKYLKYLRGGR